MPNAPAIAERPRKSAAFVTAERVLGHAALCIVGTWDRQRRSWDDNQGGHPTRLVVTMGDPRQASEIYNRGVHSAGGLYHTLAFVWLRSRRHADLMKAWIERSIGGEEMLSGWRDVPPWQYEIMFGMAAETLGFDVFDDPEHVRRVTRKMRGGR